jgi:hypothetical protein
VHGSEFIARQALHFLGNGQYRVYPVIQFVEKGSPLKVMKKNWHQMISNIQAE